MRHVKMWVSENFAIEAKKKAAEKRTSMIKLTDQLAKDMQNSQFKASSKPLRRSYNNGLKF